MGDYLYNSEMGPWACVSVCQAAWSTDGHTEAHLLSLSLLYILSFPGRTFVVLWTFFVFSSLTHLKLNRDWPFFTFALLDLLFSPVGIFFFCSSVWSPALLRACQPFLLPCSPSPFPPILHRSLSPRAWFLGHALLTHCDSPALWTPCLPTDNHMLPRHSSGKPLRNLLSHKCLSVSSTVLSLEYL